eukprot:763584-Hanusia_phi.AAC.1
MARLVSTDPCGNCSEETTRPQLASYSYLREYTRTIATRIRSSQGSSMQDHRASENQKPADAKFSLSSSMPAIPTLARPLSPAIAVAALVYQLVWLKNRRRGLPPASLVPYRRTGPARPVVLSPPPGRAGPP